VLKTKVILAVIGILIIIGLIGVSFGGGNPGVFSGSILVKPKTFYHTEFEVKSPSVLEINLKPENQNSNFIWYVFNTTADKYETEFESALYYSNRGDGVVIDRVEIHDPGVYTFVFIQTNPLIEEEVVNVNLKLRSP